MSKDGDEIMSQAAYEVEQMFQEWWCDNQKTSDDENRLRAVFIDAYLLGKSERT